MLARLFFSHLLFALLTAIPYCAFSFTPTLSALCSRTFTSNDYVVSSGVFDVRNRNVNFGFEFTNQFHISKSYFIKTGIRYGQFRNIITGKNQIPELFDNPSPMLWERRYEAFTVPLHIGKEIAANGTIKGNAFIGVSLGILTTSFAKNQIESGVARNINFKDEISITVVDNTNQTPTYFLPTADIGANFFPFKSLPRFSAGILCSFQLLHTLPASYSGVVQNTTKGDVYNYKISHEHQFINCSVALNYKFGKLKPIQQRGNKREL